MIKLQNISKIYTTKKREIHALQDINLEFENVGFILISGASGSGKTTLLNVISQSIKPTTGKLVFKGMNESQSKIKMDNFRSHNFGLVFQEHNLIKDLNVLDNIKLALSLQNKTFNEIEIIEIFKRIGLENELQTYPEQLSGGQKQRVAIARALVLDYRVILADEPTGALDEENSKEIFKILKEISKDKTVIVVSHNTYLAKMYADRLITLDKGKVVKDEVINQTKSNDSEFDFNNNKVGSKFLGRLGFKYIKYKSPKIYISLFMMVISFSLLFLSLSSMTFSKEKAYDKGLKSEDVQYGFIIKREYKEYSYDQEILTVYDQEDIKKSFHWVFMKYDFYAHILSKDKSIKADALSFINMDIVKQMGFHLIGQLPKENEVVLSKYQADNLDINESNFKESKVIIRSNEYAVSGVIDYKGKKSGLENTLILNDGDIKKNQFDINSAVVAAVVDSSNYSTITEVLNKLENKNTKYKYIYDNVIYDSVERAQLFSDQYAKAGIIISCVFSVLALLILISVISGTITEKKEDVYILKRLGCGLKNIFNVFVIQAIVLVGTSVIISIIVSLRVEAVLNNYAKKDFYFLVDLFAMDLSTVFYPLLAMICIVFLSTIIPLIKIKIDK